MPGAPLAPAASRAKIKKHTSVVTTGTPDRPGIPCAMVLTVSFALSSVTGLSCHRRSQDHHLESLASASGCQDHTTLPSAIGAFVLCANASTASRTQRP